MKVSIKVNNLVDTQTLDRLFQSMIIKSLGDFDHIKEVQIDVSRNDDSRVPIDVSLSADTLNGDTIITSAASVNYLAAFSQALRRMERQMVKQELARRA